MGIFEQTLNEMGKKKKQNVRTSAPSVRTGDYVVEVIDKGRKYGRMKVFRSLQKAKKYARQQYDLGKGVVIDKMSKYGQTTLVEKGLGRTALQMKHSDFGKL
jgi:hypothetical protein